MEANVYSRQRSGKGQFDTEWFTVPEEMPPRPSQFNTWIQYLHRLGYSPMRVGQQGNSVSFLRLDPNHKTEQPSQPLPGYAALWLLTPDIFEFVFFRNVLDLMTFVNEYAGLCVSTGLLTQVGLELGQIKMILGVATGQIKPQRQEGKILVPEAEVTFEPPS